MQYKKLITLNNASNYRTNGLLSDPDYGTIALMDYLLLDPTIGLLGKWTTIGPRLWHY